MKELYEYIGRITVLMVHVDFVLSYYSCQIGFTPKSDYHYFADTKTGQKLERLIDFVENRANFIKDREKVIVTLGKLDELITKRNRFIHSLILSTKGETPEFRSYRYILKNQKISSDFRGFEISEVKDVEKEFGALYTEISSYLES